MNSDLRPTANSRSLGSGRKRAAAWIFFLMVVGFAGAGLSHYRIDNNLHNWSPGSAGHRLTETYVIIGGEKQWLDVDELTRSLNALPEVMFCIGPDAVAAPPFMPYRSPSDADRRGTAFDDAEYTGLFCFARADVDSGRFLDSVKTAVEHTLGGHAHHVALGGPPVFAAALDDWSQRRLPLISALIVCVGSVLLIRVTGGVRSAISASAAIVGGQVILVGLLSWLGVAMDMVMSMVSPLMMAMGYSFAAHRALRPKVSGTLALCAATTTLGIFSFAFTDIPPIRSFAIWGAAGLMLTWASVTLLVRGVPAAPRRRRSKRARPRRVLRAAYALAFGYPRWVVFSALLLTLAAAVCLPLLQLQRDPIHYFPQSTRVYRDYICLDERLIGMLPFEVVVRDPGPPADAGAVEAGDMLSRTPGVRLVVDISLLEPGQTRRYLGFAGAGAMPDLVAAQDRWQRWADEHHVLLQWTGVAAQLQAVAVGLGHVSRTAFPAMVLLAGVAVWLISGRGVRLALIGVWVNLLPIAALVPAVYLAGLPLSLPSVMIGSIAVGAAIDDTLHFAVELRTGRGIRRAWLRCLRPCAGSSLVAAGCMAMFLLSPFRPTAEFGALMGSAIIAALGGDLFLLPALWTLTGHPRGV